MMDLREHLVALSRIKSRLSEEDSRMISLMVSGSHLYGFNSKDSDVDYRGTYLLKTNQLLGLKKPKDVIEIKDADNDIVMFEIGKEISLALSGNCNVLEHINADQVHTTGEYIKLRQLVNNSFGKAGVYNSYRGMATFNYKKFVLQGRNTAKKYLYVFRGLMAGIYVLQTGQIEPNVEVLNKYFKYNEVKALIKAKREGTETEPISPEIDTGVMEEKIKYLFDKIDEAYLKSKIPEKPDEDDVKKINDYLVDMRLEFVDK